MKIISAIEVISKKDYRKGALLLTEALKFNKEYQGVITAQVLADGTYVVLSHYDDMVWVFNPEDFPAGNSAATRRVDFTKVPCQFVGAAKLCAAMRIAERKSSGTIVSNLKELQHFFVYLHGIDIQSTTAITPLVAMQYVEHCKSKGAKTGRKKNQGKTLSKGTLRNRFTAVEQLHKALLDTSLQFVYPWPDSSAGYLAGIKQLSNAKTPKTEVIPDAVLIKAFQYAHDYLERSEELLMLRDEMTKRREDCAHMSSDTQSVAMNKALKEMGYSSRCREFKVEIALLETSCWLIILATTGIRMSELGNLKADSYHSKVEDDEPYYFIESRSIKTGEGETSWLCPKVAIDALDVLTQLTEPLRDALIVKVQDAELKGDVQTAHDLTRIQQSCMLTVVPQGDRRIGIISDTRINKRLTDLAAAAGVDWHFASHQFRRTFAHYVVHNQLGDLRYLRDHFKHWSLDMTALYAFDDNLDFELFNEINFAYKEKRENLFAHWINSTTPLAGGLKSNVIALRNSNDAVKTYGSSEEMIRAVSRGITVRSTGIAWCTNDALGCAGGKCDDCCHSIIDDSNQYRWEAMYAQQVELRAIADQAGPGGSATIERTIKRCEAVLRELGADIDAIKKRVAEHA